MEKMKDNKRQRITDRKLRILDHALVSGNMRRIVLERPEGVSFRPGQFMNLRIDGCFLRRPISLCDWDEHSVSLLYRVAGRGTEILSGKCPGEELDALLPLGNGFDLTEGGARPLVIGGGAGAAPLIGLCRRLCEAGSAPRAVLGFRTADEIFGREALKALGVETLIATEDGSEGAKGFVTGLIGNPGSTCFFACGPEAMLRAVDETMDGSIPGQMSFEERMGCGFGACMGCSCRTKYGSKRICREGPVLRREEVIW